MSIDKITVQATISADKNKVWEYYTKPNILRSGISQILVGIARLQQTICK